MKSKSGDEICVVCDRNFRKDTKKPIPELIIAEKVAVQEKPKVEAPVIVAEPPKPVAVVEHVKQVVTVTKISHDTELGRYGSKVIENKIRQLLERLESESDFGQIKNLIETIEKLKNLQTNVFTA